MVFYCYKAKISALYRYLKAFMNPLLNTAVKALRAAGDIITQSIEHLDKVNISKNTNNQIVTKIDTASFEKIKQGDYGHGQF